MGRQREIAAILRDHVLERIALLAGLELGAAPYVVEQLARRLRRLGHLVVEPVVGEGGKAQETRTFAAK
jgi:hypothetical protein